MLETSSSMLPCVSWLLCMASSLPSHTWEKGGSNSPRENFHLNTPQLVPYPTAHPPYTSTHASPKPGASSCVRLPHRCAGCSIDLAPGPPPYDVCGTHCSANLLISVGHIVYLTIFLQSFSHRYPISSSTSRLGPPGSTTTRISEIPFQRLIPGSSEWASMPCVLFCDLNSLDTYETSISLLMLGLVQYS